MQIEIDQGHVKKKWLNFWKKGSYIKLLSTCGNPAYTFETAPPQWRCNVYFLFDIRSPRLSIFTKTYILTVIRKKYILLTLLSSHFVFLSFFYLSVSLSVYRFIYLSICPPIPFNSFDQIKLFFKNIYVYIPI